ncbi:thermonuclease family protein [Mammaliicoccus sp. Dog046]|uniref:thermonuclease family protein n=1 Tax=Mammaliicoccus sp. Dog046 TaxID=3034233 RepID=UPI002B261B28|nr:thermonuclease family protein [Mammaliicoccus sp. Dog046]WQK84950.1 thermonuclease family protein [Mammaliicoccus sp. Dog046]
MKKFLFWGLCIIIFAMIVGIFSEDSTDNESGNQSKDKVKEEQKKSNKPKQVTKEKTESTEVQSVEDDKAQDDADQTESSTEEVKKKTKKSYTPGTTDRIPVELADTVDGDTAKFFYNGKKSSFRFLLIDTPETKHPRLGKQPFGQEASDRTKELLTNANQIEVEFDVGGKQDKYQRYLAYIYVDGEMLNDILVEEGLAKVAYVYPPSTRYLEQLESSEAIAKEQKRGIWSLGSAFDEETTEQATTQTPEVQRTPEVSTESPSVENSNRNESYPNCTELRKVYPNGVPSTHPAYALKHDRDKDNFACEAS